MIVVAAVRENGEWKLCVEGPAGPRALRSDGGRGGSLIVGRAFIRVARSVLGTNNDPGDCAVVAWCGAHCFVPAFRGNGAWFLSGRNCGNLLRAGRTGIGRWRVHFRPALRGDESRPKRLSIWGHCAGDRALGAADGLRMENRASSICGGLYGNCRGVILDAGMAGTRIPVDTMNCYVRAQARSCLADRQR